MRTRQQSFIRNHALCAFQLLNICVIIQLISGVLALLNANCGCSLCGAAAGRKVRGLNPLSRARRATDFCGNRWPFCFSELACVRHRFESRKPCRPRFRIERKDWKTAWAFATMKNNGNRKGVLSDVV